MTPATAVDRASKSALTVLALALLVAEFLAVSEMWPPARVMVPAVFAGALVGGLLDRRAVAPILAVSYVVPILVFGWSGRYHVTYSLVWIAGLLGVVTPSALRTAWNLPSRWATWLTCWVAGVCLTAPIVAMRTVDFQWELLVRGRFPTEALGGLPLLTIAWVLHVALLLAVGALWFDWLCDRDAQFLLRWVALPLGFSVGLLAAVACYQLFVDVTFLNPTVYGVLRRASGTLLDGNAAGALAACWIGGWTACALRYRDWRRWLTLILAAAMWLPVWATASRTALALAAIVTLFSAMAFATLGMRVRRRVVALAVVAAIAVVAGAGLLASLSGNTRGPLWRIAVMLPSRDLEGVKGALAELWNRNGYGVAATRAIQAYPWFGLGVGAFHEMSSEFVPNLPPDNAQNWYRHQVAELGVVGSVGWMLFLASFAIWIARRERKEPAARPLLGVLVAVAIISLLGMPGQDPYVAITLWTFAAWFVATAAQARTRTPPSRLAWVVASAIVVVFTVGTAAMAVGPLRVASRVQRLGGEYTYGFYWPEPDGKGGEYRWARKRATAVVPVETRSLELTLRTNSASLTDHPTKVRAWVDGRRVIDATLRTGADSVTQAVVLPVGEERVVIDTSADHADQAPPPDGRELAVMVAWRFLPSSR